MLLKFQTTVYKKCIEPKTPNTLINQTLFAFQAQNPTPKIARAHVIEKKYAGSNQISPHKEPIQNPKLTNNTDTRDPVSNNFSSSTLTFFESE